MTRPLAYGPRPPRPPDPEPAPTLADACLRLGRTVTGIAYACALAHGHPGSCYGATRGAGLVRLARRD